MEDLKIYGLTNKENQRVYGSCNNLVLKGFDKGNLSKYLNKKSKSINGYTDLIDFEILNERYDTLVFNSRDLEVNDYYLSQFIDSKEIALLENKDFIIHKIMGMEWIIKKKSIGFYNVSFYYNNLFLFHMAKDKVQIKVLSAAFYLCTYEEILQQLNYICLAMFKFTLEQKFIVNKLDYAIDIRFKNFDLIQEVIDGNKDFKFFGGKGQFKIYKEKNLGKSVTLNCGAVQYIIYDKVLEVFQNDDKKSLYKNLFNIDFFNEFELDDYNSKNDKVVRFEYRIKNQNDYLVSKGVNVTRVFTDLLYVKNRIFNLLNKHTSFQIPEEDILREIFKNDSELITVEVDEDNNIEQQIWNSLKVLYSYSASIQSRQMILEGNYNLEQGLENLFDFIRRNVENYNYFEKVADKMQQVNNRKYK